jgi:hypothetical protein
LAARPFPDRFCEGSKLLTSVIEPRIFFQPLNQSAGPSFVSQEFTRRGLMGRLRRGIAGFSRTNRQNSRVHGNNREFGFSGIAEDFLNIISI